MGNYYSFKQNSNTDRAWKHFAPIINNNFGTAALIAGLYFQSGLDPYTRYEEYRLFEKLDFKTFAYDKIGFGIGKWKNWARKLSLYNICKADEKPIYDFDTQMKFVMDEFSGLTYGPVLRELTDATSVKEAAYKVYDSYLDVKKRSDEKRDICAEMAMDIYSIYGDEPELRTPVKYVVAGKKTVRVRGQKGKKIPFLRKLLGYLNAGQEYRFICVSDDGREYAIYFGDDFGYVNAEKVRIVTRMEVVK